MIIDTSGWTRKVLDLRGVLEELKTLAQVPSSFEWIEYWRNGKQQHCYKWGSETISKMRLAGAKVQHPGDDFRICNKCGKPLLSTGQQKSFGKLYKCPECSVSWWGKPTALPADASTRNARRLTAEILTILRTQSWASDSILRHDRNPIGCLNAAECRIESLKLTDINVSEARRMALIEALDKNALLSKDDVVTACKIVHSKMVIQGDEVVEVPEGASSKWTLVAPGQIEILPPGMKFKGDPPDNYKQMICYHEWDATIQRCRKCGITQEAFYYQIGMMKASEPITTKQEPQTGGRLIDLE